MKEFFKSMLQDERGATSSKRVCGIICTLILCLTLFANQFTDEHTKPSDTLVECVSALAFGCLGLSTIDKFSLKKTDEK
tara:strand:- start:153 stop:389 length:237 start_codon:yes stop_codon:yes gene_type:complete